MHKPQDPPRDRPLSDYGLIGDCHSAALITSDGSLDWLCVPRFDSPSLFARLLDPDRGGHFSLRPATSHRAEARYIEDTGILRTIFRTGGGRAVLTDFMPVRAGRGPRPHAELEAPRLLIRLIEVQAGEVDLSLDFQPRPEYATATPRLEADDDGKTVRVAGGLTLFSPRPLDVTPEAATATFRLGTGERLALVLALEPGTARVDQARAWRWLEETLGFWREWIAGSHYEGPYEAEVRRSAITLKLLTYAPTGAMVAAPTTSLPETIGGVRNWDYRYTWIRDASLGAYALFHAGHVEDAERFMEWVDEVAVVGDPSPVHVMYKVDGATDLPEHTLDHLSGYRGSRPVHVGNAANEQFQLETYGYLLDSFFAYRTLDRLPHAKVAKLWPDFRRQVQHVIENWERRDSGIWEVRTGPHHFVVSKVLAWVALDRGIRIAEEEGLEADLEAWKETCEAIARDVLRNGYAPGKESFLRAYGEPDLDASSLLLPIVHFMSARDPRMAGTIAAIERELEVDGLVYRYRADDGLPGEEGAFTVCSFWLVDNYLSQGRHEKARALFEKLLAHQTPLGLFAEQLDPRTGEHLGNFPQALTHLGLITSALNLAHAAKAAEREVTGVEEG